MQPLRTILMGAALALGPSSSALAQEEAEDRTPKAEDWERQLRENQIERSREITRRRVAKLSRLEEGTRRFTCRIESLLDGTLMISKKYDPAVEPVLMRFGHRKVNAPPDHIGRVLHDGRSYQIFALRDDVPLWKVEKYMGQDVELELEKFEYSGQVRVVRIREMPRPESNRQ